MACYRVEDETGGLDVEKRKELKGLQEATCFSWLWSNAFKKKNFIPNLG